MKYGDILVHKEAGKKKVLGVCGEVVFISLNNNFSKVDSFNYTEQELLDYGWRVEEKPWEPKKGSDVWFIGPNGESTLFIWMDYEPQLEIRDFLGVFPTKEACDARIKEIRALVAKG